MSNKKKFVIVFIIFLFASLGLVIAYVISELNTENDVKITGAETTDSMKFKVEYESLNNKVIEDNKVYRSVNIPDDNVFKYSKAQDIVDKINNSESFIVYFGYASSNRCRYIIESLIKSIKNNNINSVYYVDLSHIRDEYILNENNEAVKSVEGTDGYYNLLSALDSILPNYGDLSYTKKKKVINVAVNEKRIFEPSIILVKDGIPQKLINGINENDDVNAELTDEIINKQVNTFNDFLKEINTSTTSQINSSNVCTEPGSC